MNAFNEELSSRLKDVREQGLYRQLHQMDSPQRPRIEIEGKSLLNFSSNDYLGLANDPALKEAALDAVNKFGAGAGAKLIDSVERRFLQRGVVGEAEIIVGRKIKKRFALDFDARALGRIHLVQLAVKPLLPDIL